MVLVLSLLALLVWKFRPTCATDEPIQGQVNFTPNGNVNLGRNNISKETVDDTDDDPMLEP